MFLWVWDISFSLCCFQCGRKTRLASKVEFFQSCCFGKPELLCAARFSQPCKLRECPQAPPETATDLANTNAPLSKPMFKQTKLISSRCRVQTGRSRSSWYHNPSDWTTQWWCFLPLRLALLLLLSPQLHCLLHLLFSTSVSLPAQAWTSSLSLSLKPPLLEQRKMFYIKQSNLMSYLPVECNNSPGNALSLKGKYRLCRHTCFCNSLNGSTFLLPCCHMVWNWFMKTLFTFFEVGFCGDEVNN